MTKAIIRSQHSGSVNLLLRYSILFAGLFFFFRSIYQAITKENLFVHCSAGNKDCPYYHAIFLPIFSFTYPLAGEFK